MNGTSDLRRLVTFDLGGVVIRVAPTVERAASLAKVPWRAPRLRVQPERASKLLLDWQVGAVSDREFFARWAEALGGRFSAEEAERISLAWMEGEYEGVGDVVRELRARGHLLGCLSNTCGHHWDLAFNDTARFPTLQHFTYRHASHLVGVMKPDPWIYELYEEATGVSGEQIVFFDDRQENVRAALERGWRAYVVRTEAGPAEQMRRVLRELMLVG